MNEEDAFKRILTALAEVGLYPDYIDGLVGHYTRPLSDTEKALVYKACELGGATMNVDAHYEEFDADGNICG